MEEQIYRGQLRDAVAAVLVELSEEQRELLRLRYWEGRTLSELAAARGVAIEGIRQKEKKAIRELRKPRNACRLHPFYDFSYYSGTGLGAFRSTGASIEERYLIRKEELQEREERRQQRADAQKHRAALDAEMQRMEEETLQRVTAMTPEEKRALLEKYGYA